jgi:hypothetical protein
LTYLTSHPRGGAFPTPPTTLLTWLTARPAGTFVAALGTDRAGDTLTLPARSVVRATVPPGVGVVRSGQDLFDWLQRHRLAPAGPTVEEHLLDGDGASAVVLEIPVAQVDTRS